jgi:hypothetical protein
MIHALPPLHRKTPPWKNHSGAFLYENLNQISAKYLMVRTIWLV